MKYFKYARVDAVTRESIRRVKPTSGPTHPFTELPGLSVKWTRDGWNYGTADDTATADAQKHRFELTATEWNDAIQEELALRVAEYKDQIKIVENRIRVERTKDFHYTELAAAAFRVEEAKNALAAADDATADVVAPFLKIESSIRGITTKEVATKVMANFNSLMTMECYIAATSAKKAQELDDNVFDPANPLGCLEAFDVLVDSGNTDFNGDPIMVPKFDVNSGWPDLDSL